MAKRLYRSTTDVVVAGVCGGLGKSLGIDPAFIRLFFVLGIWGGFSLFIYPVLWMVLPREDQVQATAPETAQAGATEMAAQARNLGQTFQTHSRGSSDLRGIFLGGLLVLIGISTLGSTLHLYWLNSDLIWPLAMILGGLILVQRRTRDE